MSDKTPSRDPFDLCGTTIQGKYRIDEVVGTGGFGVVYRGEHTGFGEPIAVKCLKLPSELEPEQRDKLLARLQDEGRVLHRLSRLSSGIVQALDVGAITSAKGQWVPYLVLEWLEGQTLAEHVKQRVAEGQERMTLEQAIELLEPAARALAVAHQQKVAHRDVKPENLVLTQVSGQQTLKVLDFGIAKVLAHHSEFTAAPAATQKVATAFTPNYGAPEQFNKKRGATGPWTDVFALALILVELVSGERALDGDDATQLYIAAADPAARPTLRYRGVETSDAVDRVLRRALAVDPHDRYADAGTFWDDLREAAGQRPSPPSTATDHSETGEFVSRHGIGVEPEQLSRIDRALEQQPTADRAGTTPLSTVPEGEQAGDQARTMRAVPGQRDGGKSRAGSSLGAAEPVAAPPAPAPRSGTQPSAVAVRTETAETLPPTSAADRRSRRWMGVVAIAALAGAGLLYAKLRQEQVGPGSNGALRTEAPPTRSAAPQRRRQTDAGALGGADAVSLAAGGQGGASASGGQAGQPADGGVGGAERVPEPPDDMVYIPLPRDGPVPGVERGFFLDRTEVTTRAYRECVSAGRCVRANRVVLTQQVADELWGTDPSDPGAPATAPETLAEAWGERCNDARDELGHPVNCINQASAADYCRWKGRRLPTAAEWVLAASGGTSRPYPWGTDPPKCGDACFGLNGSCVTSSPQVATCPVGTHSRDRTPEGVMDLAANVAEWVADDVPTPAHLQPRRIALGGSFTDEASDLASAPKKTLPAVTAFVTIGFRCAMDAVPPAPARDR